MKSSTTRRRRNTEVSKEERERVLAHFSEARTSLIGSCPFFAHLALWLTPVPVWRVNSLSVNRKGECFINPLFFEQLTPKEREGAVAHEVLHLVFDTFQRGEGKIGRLVNHASDYVINDILKRSFFKLPPNVLYNEKYTGWSFEEVYDDLLKNKVEVLVDNLVLVDDLEDTDGDESDKNSRFRWTEAILSAYRHARLSGHWSSLPGNLLRMVEKIVAGGNISWQEVLSRFLSTCGKRDVFTFTRPNRRSSSVGVILPSLSRSYPRIAIILDTSGSISPSKAEKFLGEVACILDGLGLSARVVGCDVKVYFDIENASIDELMRLWEGGGGSDLRPAFEVVSKEDATIPIIVFTDGQVTVPETAPSNPVCWVLVEEGDAPPAEWGLPIYGYHKGG